MRTKSAQREKTSPRSSNRKTKPPSEESPDIERRNRPYLEAEAEYLRQRSSVLTVDAVRKAIPIFQEHRNKLVRASVIPSGDVNTVAKEKKKLRNSLNRMLLKTIPRYKGVLKSQRSHLDKYAALFQEEVSTHILNPLTVTLGEPITDVQLTQREFTPPFEFGDVSKSEMQPLIKVDQSFVDPETGILVHDLRFRHNDDGWFNWGGDPFGWSEQHCRIGVNFRVPETGFVDFNVVIQNLYNKISYSVSDNFGFSDATLQIFHSLIVRVVRVGSGQRFGTETEMVTAGIVSFGEEYSFSTSQIQNSTPFTLSFRNEDAYLKGEQLRVEVVSRIYIRSSVNDMQTHVDAVIAWQLKKILVSMV